MNDFFSLSPTGTQLGYGTALGSFGMPQSGANLSFGSTGVAPAPVSLPRITPPSPSPAITPAAGTAGAGGAADMTWGDQFKSTFFNEGGGLNFENIGSIAETLGSLGTLWSGIQSNKIARDSLNMQKKAYATNLRNQTQSYNTTLEDRARARYAQMGQAGQADAYIEDNKLKG